MPAYTVYPSRNILRLVKWQMFGQITLKAGQSFQLFFQCAVIPSADPQVSIRLPSGQRITRRFRPEDPLEQMARDLEKSRRAVKSSGEQWRAMEKSCFSRFPPCLAHHASAKTLEILGVSWSLFSGVRGAWDWLWLLTKCFRLLDYNNFVLTWSLWVSLYDKITRSIIFALSSWSQLPWRRSLLVWWTFPLRSVVPQSWLTLSSFEDDFAIAIIYCNIYICVYIYV